MKQYSRATADNDPRCPECGFATTDWHDFMQPYAGDGDTINVICDHCEHEYPAEVVVTYSFRVRASKLDRAIAATRPTQDEG